MHSLSPGLDPQLQAKPRGKPLGVVQYSPLRWSRTCPRRVCYPP